MSTRMVITLALSVLAGMAGAGPVAAPATIPGNDNNLSPAFRGSTGSGNYRGAAATSWNESEKRGVLWAASLDLPGWASPVVWNDKVVVTSGDANRRQVYGFDAATGKPLWKTELPAVEGATREYTLDTMSAQWDEMLHAGATPATNGKQVFVLFSNGQLAALDLASGKHLWSVALGNTGNNKYGVDNSLLVSGTSVIAVFQGQEEFIAAYNAETGKQEWKSPRGSPTWASPILVRTKTGTPVVVLSSSPDVTAWDVKTGAKVWSASVLTERPQYCAGPSPVTDGERIFVNSENNGIFALDPETGALLWSLKELPDKSGFSPFASMTTDGRHLYHFLQSVLTVIDNKTGKVLTQLTLDQYGSEASPMVVGDTLYLVCSETMIVLKTGATPVKIGEGTLNNAVYASPAYAGGRLFARSANTLYCIGK